MGSRIITAIGLDFDNPPGDANAIAPHCRNELTQKLAGDLQSVAMVEGNRQNLLRAHNVERAELCLPARQDANLLDEIIQGEGLEQRTADKSFEILHQGLVDIPADDENRRCVIGVLVILTNIFDHLITESLIELHIHQDATKLLLSQKRMGIYGLGGTFDLISL